MEKDRAIKLGRNDNVVIREDKYSTEKDWKQAKKDIERVLRILSAQSVSEIIMSLAPYRVEWAKRENKYREQIEAFADKK